MQLLLIIFPHVQPDEGRFLLINMPEKERDVLHDGLISGELNIVDTLNMFQDNPTYDFIMEFLTYDQFYDLKKTGMQNVKVVEVTKIKEQ